MFDVFLQTRWTVYRSVGKDPPLHHPTAFSCPFQLKTSTKLLSINYNNSCITNIGGCASCFCLLFPWGTFPTLVQQPTIDPCSFSGWDEVWKWLPRDSALACLLLIGGLWRIWSDLICSSSLVFYPLWESSCYSGTTHIYEEGKQNRGQLQLSQTRLPILPPTFYYY